MMGISALVYQVIKYQQRDGWSHRDILRLAHPKARTENLNAVLRWASGKGLPEELSHNKEFSVIVAFEQVKQATEKAEVCRLIQDYSLPRECVPTEWLRHAEVWETLLADMPMTAMIRNLGNMSKVGLLVPGSDASRKICRELADKDKLKKARVHPVTILMAERTYASGHGLRGSGEWQAVPRVIDALDDAFYAAFGNVEPTGKRWMLGLDVSGSMASPVAGTAMSCCEGATALALVTAHTEQEYLIGRFNTGYEICPFSKKTRLDDALRYTRNINYGGTDCSLPMLVALQRNLKFDAFVVLTDSETWAGKIHPTQALRRYRDKTGVPAKLIVVGMVSNEFSIADPDDGGMMDVVGMDTAVPQIMGDFVR